jgi:hypothetical protein
VKILGERWKEEVEVLLKADVWAYYPIPMREFAYPLPFFKDAVVET